MSDFLFFIFYFSECRFFLSIPLGFVSSSCHSMRFLPPGSSGWNQNFFVFFFYSIKGEGGKGGKGENGTRTCYLGSKPRYIDILDSSFMCLRGHLCNIKINKS
jgi:hypothetical protein